MEGVDSVGTVGEVVEDFEPPDHPGALLELNAAAEGGGEECGVEGSVGFVDEVDAGEACAEEHVGADFGVAPGVVDEIDVADKVVAVGGDRLGVVELDVGFCPAKACFDSPVVVKVPADA